MVSYLVPWGEERERGRKRRTFIVLAHIRLVVHNSDSPNVARRLLRTSLHLGRHAALALLNVRLVGRCTVVHAVVGDAVVERGLGRKKAREMGQLLETPT